MEDSKITVYSLPGAWGLTSASPFCLKVETYLRMVGEPYALKFPDPRKAPRGKFPWVEHAGEVITDSHLIIEHFEGALGRALDTGMDAADRARAHLVRKTVEDSLYFCVLHQRWARDDNFEHIKPLFKGMVPPVFLPLVQRMARKGVLKALHGQGMGRREAAEVDRLAAEDIDALAATLGDEPFLLGDQPRSIDACVLSFAMQLCGASVMSGPTRAHFLSHDNLRAYVERGQKAYWPDCDVLKSAA